jgi:light-regulated signal transduction histidine kinase (bacteriophytochrome)
MTSEAAVGRQETLLDNPQPVPASREIERLQRELAQTRTEMEDFTYSISHDLRAPLRHINAYAQIIEEDMGEQAGPAITKHLNTIRQAAHQMGCQIDGLTSLSRLARLDLQVGQIDLAALVHDVCDELAPSLNGRVVHWQIAPNFPPLQGDRGLVRQVLGHLLDNALKFTRQRSSAVINVTWQQLDTGQCAVTISDNGTGFNPQFKDKLFHVFSRLHPVHEFEGLGMGLVLCRKIIERHGGTMWAEGRVEAGCQVSFTLTVRTPMK